ncbi:uncharacterized protein LOC141623238 [Silene latifolia]|uniref:uncharacterized protein LOC141623238 n=1 Tax=Silene latifolia TaxID=37657 RepID=UPI003D777B8B
MAKCFSFTTTRDTCYRFSFEHAGLKSTTVVLDECTTIHCWSPKKPNPKKPNLVLLHGLGANAMWQWDYFISPLTPKFNIYVPDLIFFGESHTTRPERSETFQAQSVMRAMEKLNVKKMSVAGISYGGFVAYSMAAQFAEAVEKVVIVCAGVCLEEKDMEDGMFKVNSVDEAADILLPQSSRKLRELLQLSFYKPIKLIPSCFLDDFIQVMCTEYREERKQLIAALHKDRKLANLPKINQTTLIIWGEHDQVFPVELAHRLKRYIGDSAQLVIVKKAGHALNIEKPKHLYKNMKAFLLNKPLPKSASSSNENSNSNSVK